MNNKAQQTKAMIARDRAGCYHVAIAGIATEQICRSLAEAMAIAYQAMG